jgi:hypothetical protein
MQSPADLALQGPPVLRTGDGVPGAVPGRGLGVADCSQTATASGGSCVLAGFSGGTLTWTGMYLGQAPAAGLCLGQHIWMAYVCASP